MELSAAQLKGFHRMMVVPGVLFCILSIAVRADNPKARYDESQTPFTLLAPIHINNLGCALTLGVTLPSQPGRMGCTDDSKIQTALSLICPLQLGFELISKPLLC